LFKWIRVDIKLLEDVKYFIMYFKIRYFTIVIALWLLILFLGIFISSISYIFLHNLFISALTIQLTYLVVSCIFAKYILDMDIRVLGFRLSIPNSKYILHVFILSISSSIVLAYLGYLIGDGKFIEPIPGLTRDLIIYSLIAFIFAPIGEETLFRGFLIGALVLGGIDMETSIFTSAILFSLIHLIPFKTAPPTQLTIVLVTAFILSIIAGIYRVKANSIVPSIVTHICFNLGGMLIYLILT